MGIHICVYVLGPPPKHAAVGSVALAEWDVGRHAGDREFAGTVFPKLPSVRVGDSFEGDWCYRPADFRAWRDEIARHSWPNPGRFEKLVDLLEANPNYWVYFSW